MPNYQKGKIYKIVCFTTKLCYIGSTAQNTLAERLSGHTGAFKHWKKGKTGFTSSFTVMEQGNYFIELLEGFPCNSKDELNARELFHIQNTDCVNIKMTGKGNEYYKKNRELILSKQKDYEYELKHPDPEKKLNKLIEKQTKVIEMLKEKQKNELEKYKKEYNLQ